LSVVADGKGLVGHAGAILLRKAADQTGLTVALGAAVRRPGFSPGWDRGVVLVQIAVSIVLGGTALADLAVLAHQAALFGEPASDSTARRVLLDVCDDKTLRTIAKARARVRAHVWSLIKARPGGFPWLNIAGKLLTGWIVIDLDATLITAHSAKQGAAATFKQGWGFHPLGSWCANTQERLSMLLRPGNAGSNTVADHLTVLTQAIAQIPAAYRAKILIRIDGAGATHDLIEHISGLNTRRRTVRFTVGFAITDVEESAIKILPERAWQTAWRQNGSLHQGYEVAELTGLDTRAEAWLPGLRLIARRTKPSRRHLKNLTDYEKTSGWRYSVTATDIHRLGTLPGTHHIQFLDVLHRSHATVEDRVRTGKAMGLRNLPSKTWNVNVGWVLAASIATDLDAWTRLLGLYDHDNLALAEPETMRHTIYHLPAKLTRHARRRRLHLAGDWPWREAFTTCWTRLNTLPAPA
jgi:hypothetical protein